MDFDSPVNQEDTPESSTPSKPRMNQPPPPPPTSSLPNFDVSSIRGSDVSNVSLLTDESAEGIPLNDALIHSTLGSLMDDSNVMESSIKSFAQHEIEAGRPEVEEQGLREETPNLMQEMDMSSAGLSDLTGIPHPPDSDDDEEWLARSAKKVPLDVPSKDISRVQDFDDFNHPNVDTGKGSISKIEEEDPFESAQLRTKSSTTKSSDEDDYEVIPAQEVSSHDECNISNPMSMSHSSAGNTTVLETTKDLRESSSPSVVLRDSESHSVSHSVSQKKQEESLLFESPVASAAPSVSETTSQSSLLPSPKDVSQEVSEPKPDSSSALLSKQETKKSLPDSPKKTPSKKSDSIMASEEASSTTGCPYTAGKRQVCSSWFVC